MKLTESTINHIEYVDKNYVASTRYIIPMMIPQSNVRAIDVSDCTANERVELSRLVTEYNQYRQNIINTMFTFENWLAHQGERPTDIKWRSFAPDGIKVIS